MLFHIYMEQISFNDLPKDVYVILIDIMIIRLTMNEFKNYTIADKKSLLDDYVKDSISKYLLNINISNYLNFVDDFANKYKVHMQKNFDIIYTNLPSDNFDFYNELIGIVVNSNYYDCSNTEKTIIYDNLADLIPFYSTHYPRTQYYHIIDRLLNIYNVRGRNQFRITFMIFISKLKQDLLDNNVSKENMIKIIIKVISSFNWNNEMNVLY